jgi:hypothetical protein
MADPQNLVRKPTFAPIAASGDAGRGFASHGGGAGLVISETTPNERKAGACRTKGDNLSVTFSPEETARKRIKRLKKGVWFAGRLHGSMAHKPGHRPDVAYFVTLTYVGVNDWSAEHLTRATDAYRRHCKRFSVPARYLWVAELQKRGAVHYHLVAWLPRGVSMPKWDKSHTAPSGREVSAFWSHGMTNTQKVKSSATAYLMKYLSKCSEFFRFPDGLRLFGVGGLDPQSRAVRSWSNLPEWAKCEHGVGELRRCGSTLVIAETGEIVEPVWRCQLIPCGIRLELLRDYPERFHEGPYSSWSPHASKP